MTNIIVAAVPNSSTVTVLLPNATTLLDAALSERNFKTDWRDSNTLMVEGLTFFNLKRLKEFLEHYDTRQG